MARIMLYEDWPRQDLIDCLNNEISRRREVETKCCNLTDRLKCAESGNHVFEEGNDICPRCGKPHQEIKNG